MFVKDVYHSFFKSRGCDKSIKSDITRIKIQYSLRATCIYSTQLFVCSFSLCDAIIVSIPSVIKMSLKAFKCCT